MITSYRKRGKQSGGALRAAAVFSATALLLAACGGTEEAAPEPAAPAAPATPDAPAEAEPFYKEGDLVTVVVPFGEGGGTDVLARLVLPYLGQRLGGVNFQVENLPGGGSITGVNTWANQRNPEDGMTLLFHSASSQIPGIIGQEGVMWSFEDQCPVAGFPLGGGIYSKTDGPLQSGADLAGINQTEQITYGGQPAAGGELRILLLFEIFGTDVNTVLGYDGRGPSRLAFEQGESDVSYDTTPAYLANVQPLVDSGIAQPLMTFGFVTPDGGVGPDPQLSDIPSPGQIYQEVFGSDIRDSGDAYNAYRAISLATIALNKSLVVHCDAPAEAQQQLRDTFHALVQDPITLDAIKAETGGYPVLTLEDVDAAWNQMVNVNVDSPEIQWMFNWLEEKYDVQLGG